MYRNANTIQIQIRDRPSSYIIDVSPKTWRWALRISVSYSGKSADTSQPYSPLCFCVFDQVDEINNTDETKDTIQMTPQIKLRRSSLLNWIKKNTLKKEWRRRVQQWAGHLWSQLSTSFHLCFHTYKFVFEHFKINPQLCILKYDNFSNDYDIINLQVCI